MHKAITEAQITNLRQVWLFGSDFFTAIARFFISFMQNLAIPVKKSLPKSYTWRRLDLSLRSRQVCASVIALCTIGYYMAFLASKRSFLKCKVPQRPRWVTLRAKGRGAPPKKPAQSHCVSRTLSTTALFSTVLIANQIR